MAQGVVKVSAPAKPATASDKAMSRKHHRDSMKLAKMSMRYHKQHGQDHLGKKGLKGAEKMFKKHQKAFVKLASE